MQGEVPILPVKEHIAGVCPERESHGRIDDTPTVFSHIRACPFGQVGHGRRDGQKLQASAVHEHIVHLLRARQVEVA